LSRMLPPEILDQVTSLNIQQRELVAVINQLTRLQGGQIELDDLSNTIRSGFAKADRAVEVSSSRPQVTDMIRTLKLRSNSRMTWPSNTKGKSMSPSSLKT